MNRERGRDERPGVLFAAKRAARRRQDHAHLLRGQRQRACDVLLLVVGLVRSTDDRDASCIVQIAEQRLPFERTMFQVGRAIFAHNGDCGIRERRGEVARLDLLGRQHIAPARDTRRVRGQRPLDVEGMRQDGIARLDGCRALRCSGRRFSDYQCDRCAKHTQSRTGRRQQRLVLAVVAQAVLARDVTCGQHRNDAGHAARCSGLQG